MKVLEEYIQGYIGLPLAMLLPVDRDLYPLDNKDPDKAYLFGTNADQELFLTQTSIKKFLKDAPVGYAMGGHVGHGVNSYAIFVVLRDELRRIFFRLPIGNIYENRDRQAARIKKFLPSYLEFEARVKRKVSSIIAIDSMLLGIYKFTLKSGRIIELSESLFPDADFEVRFKQILEEPK